MALYRANLRSPHGATAQDYTTLDTARDAVARHIEVETKALGECLGLKTRRLEIYTAKNGQTADIEKYASAPI